MAYIKKVKDWLKSNKTPQFEVVVRYGYKITVVKRLSDGLVFQTTPALLNIEGLGFTNIQCFHDDLIHVTRYNKVEPVEINSLLDSMEWN